MASGKTTTLVARIAWLIDSGVDPGTIAAITFNKRAADELQERLATAVKPLGVAADSVRVRTFHALGREILHSAGKPVEPLVDRTELLRSVAPAAGPAGWRRLDDAFSRLKLDLGVTVGDVAADPEAGPIAMTFVSYERALAKTGGLDFDDLVARSLRLLQNEAVLLAEWRERCGDLLVDEVQDVDRSQLRLALLLAAPANRVFLVGDDDQSIYGWRLADVRRVLALADDLPGLRRIDLTTNYRCPRPVVERAVRLIEENEERFRKVVRARPGAVGRLAVAPDAAGGEGPLRQFLGAPLPDGQTRAVLARTNRELMLPLAIVLEAGLDVRSSATLLFEAPLIDELLAEAAVDTNPNEPALLRLAALRDAHASRPAEPPIDDGPDRRELSEALLAWAAAFPGDDLETFVGRVADARARLAALRRDDAPLALATAHSTKGLEFDDVAVIGLEEGRFPSERSLADSADPRRALEEERRLAYVAWTRARRSLTLIFDPLRPSLFLLEAFSREELGLPKAAGRGREPAGSHRPKPGPEGRTRRRESPAAAHVAARTRRDRPGGRSVADR